MSHLVFDSNHFISSCSYLKGRTPHQCGVLPFSYQIFTLPAAPGTRGPVPASRAPAGSHNTRSFPAPEALPRGRGATRRVPRPPPRPCPGTEATRSGPSAHPRSRPLRARSSRSIDSKSLLDKAGGSYYCVEYSGEIALKSVLCAVAEHHARQPKRHIGEERQNRQHR